MVRTIDKSNGTRTRLHPKMIYTTIHDRDMEVVNIKSAYPHIPHTYAHIYRLTHILEFIYIERNVYII